MAEMTGQEIYDNFHNGAGAERLAQSADKVNTVVPRYFERAFQIQRLVAEMEPLWQGDAAQAAKHGAAPMLSAHSEAAEKFRTAQDLVGRQAGSFGEAKNKVVPVPAAPAEVTPWVLASPGTFATYQKQLGEHNSAAQHNVDVMNGYTGASTYNTDNLPKTFGTLADDQSGLSVAEPDTIDSESFGDTGDGGGSGPRGSGPIPGPTPGPTPGGDTAAGPGPGSATPPDTRLPSEGNTPGATPGTTTPGAHAPTPGATAGTPLPAADPVRPAPIGGLGPGVGVGFPIGGGGESGGRGASGGAPRGGSIGGPVPRGGAGVGAEPHGQSPRVTPTSGPAAAGRGPGTAMGGVPMGAGRGRDEDTERKTPTYLEAGDPEDVYGTDELTAPPVIGEEDDD